MNSKTGKKYQCRDANNQVGLILRSYDGGPYLFRIYAADKSFKDYEILHDDIRVQILDDSAEFIESEDGTKNYLDYSRDMLGQESKYGRSLKK